MPKQALHRGSSSRADSRSGACRPAHGRDFPARARHGRLRAPIDPPPLVFNSIQFIFLFFPLALALDRAAPRPGAQPDAAGAEPVLLRERGVAGPPASADADRGERPRRPRDRGRARRSATDRAGMRGGRRPRGTRLVQRRGFFRDVGVPGGAFRRMAGHPAAAGHLVYVFHNISYVVDVYRGAAPARRNPIDFALYISFFPQVIAGRSYGITISRTRSMIATSGWKTSPRAWSGWLSGWRRRWSSPIR